MEVLKDLSTDDKARIYQRLYMRKWREKNRDREAEADRERKAEKLERMLHNGELKQEDVLRELD